MKESAPASDVLYLAPTGERQAGVVKHHKKQRSREKKKKVAGSPTASTQPSSAANRCHPLQRKLRQPEAARQQSKPTQACGSPAAVLTHHAKRRRVWVEGPWQSSDRLLPSRMTPPPHVTTGEA